MMNLFMEAMGLQVEGNSMIISRREITLYFETRRS